MTSQARQQSEGLTFAAYPGDGAVLLAFDLDQGMQQDLAGFAVEYTDPDGHTFPVLNRLSFAQQLTSATTPEQRQLFPHQPGTAAEVPLGALPPGRQAGHVHLQGHGDALPAGQRNRAHRRAVSGSRRDADAAPAGAVPARLHARVYLLAGLRRTVPQRSDRAEERPRSTSIPVPIQAQYRWLGFHARRLIFDFLAETLADHDLSLDVFAYDLDEPDFIRQLGQLGSRLRLYLDDSASHIGGSDPEPNAHAWLAGQGAQVRLGHFQRFSHDKVLIQKRSDTAVKVLSGSANFSVRGLYVQSNNVFTFDDPATAALYEQAFQQSWDDPGRFRHQRARRQLARLRRARRPAQPTRSASARTTDAAVSLDRVTAAAITGATSSVLFAIMEIGAGHRPCCSTPSGPCRHGPSSMPSAPRSGCDGSLKVQKSGDPANAPFIPVLLPVQRRCRRRSGPSGAAAAGQVIHHKFVVTDFNGDSPQAFAGSSNLAARRRRGQRRQPGLLHRPRHRRGSTRSRRSSSWTTTVSGPPCRRPPTPSRSSSRPRSANWAADYYNPASPRCRERTVLA